jgi:cytochrome c1
MSIPRSRVITNRPARERGSALALGVLLCLGCGCAGTQHPGSTATPSPAQAVRSPVTRGEQLYQADGCSDCHSLDGTPGTGPSWKGLAGSRVRLSGGQTVIADDSYLSRHIVEPNALTVAGYPGEVMAEAIGAFDLKSKPADVRALVAFIDSVR